jgi:hypothetical protein
LQEEVVVEEVSSDHVDVSSISEREDPAQIALNERLAREQDAFGKLVASSYSMSLWEVDGEETDVQEFQHPADIKALLV